MWLILEVWLYATFSVVQKHQLDKNINKMIIPEIAYEKIFVQKWIRMNSISKIWSDIEKVS